jgi:hypothetical protein
MGSVWWVISQEGTLSIVFLPVGAGTILVVMNNHGMHNILVLPFAKELFSLLIAIFRLFVVGDNSNT